jgi:excinuclease ABC subunit C
VEISPPITLSVQHAESPEYAAALPESPGVYAFRHGTEIVHIGWAPRLRGRVHRLLSRLTSGNGTLGSRMRDAGLVLSCWPTGSRLESSLVMYQVLRTECAGDYRKRLRLSLPWFVTVTSRDRFPRVAISHRIPTGGEPAFGPFKSRDSAQLYADDVVGCFHLRRCVDALVPDPNHPGCVYGEIKQCLRPCQGVVDELEYGREVEGLLDFLSTNGESRLSLLVRAREEAAGALEFEEAANLHKLISRVKGIAKSREDLVCDVRELGGIAVTKGAAAGELRLWPMLGGVWQQPRPMTVDGSATLDSLTGRLKEWVPSLAASEPETGADEREHLAILVRWYYSSSRDGYWYPLRPDKKFNFRRVGKAMLDLANAARSL